MCISYLRQSRERSPNFDLRTWPERGAEARSNGGGAGLPELGRPRRGCFFVFAVISTRTQRTMFDSGAVTLT